MLLFAGNTERMKSADGFLLSERSDLINHTEGDGAGGCARASCPSLERQRERDGDRDSATTVRKQKVCSAAFLHVLSGHGPV